MGTGSVAGRFDLEADAREAFRVLSDGGVVLVPGDMGYGFVSASPGRLQDIFVAKRRPAYKVNGMLGDWELQRDLQVVDARAAEFIAAVTVDHGLPLGVVAPYRPNHPILATLPEETLARSSVEGTMSVVVNAGPFHNALVALSRPANLPLLGSSANLSGAGIKYRVEDVEPEILSLADMVVDYGLRRYHSYGRASTIVDMRDLSVIRAGCCYDLISDVALRQFGVKFPEDPGEAIAPGGSLSGGSGSA